jgi:hypothetical protein
MKTFSLVLLFGLIAATSPAAVQKTQPRIDEIVLEGRQGDRGSGPFGRGFKITLRRDGTALFKGIANVKLRGDFQGTISSAEFEQLESFLVARKYDRIPDDPINASRITPAAGTEKHTAYDLSGYTNIGPSPNMITHVVYEGGQTKTVSRPTNALGIDQAHIPKALFEIEQAVFDAATRIHWAKIK